MTAYSRLDLYGQHVKAAAGLDRLTTLHAEYSQAQPMSSWHRDPLAPGLIIAIQLARRHLPWVGSYHFKKM